MIKAVIAYVMQVINHAFGTCCSEEETRANGVTFLNEFSIGNVKCDFGKAAIGGNCTSNLKTIELKQIIIAHMLIHVNIFFTTS